MGSLIRIAAVTAPWITLILLLSVCGIMYRDLPPTDATAFELPGAISADVAQPGLVATVMPKGGNSADALMFFDDARYVMPDAADEFMTRVAERKSQEQRDVITMLVDRRVTTGTLMEIVKALRAAGMKKVQIAEKRE